MSSGCSIIKNLDELLTLQGYSKEQDAIQSSVVTQNKQFDELLAAEKAGALDTYKTIAAVEKTFGPPVYTKSVTSADGSATGQTAWVYRYATDYFTSPKIIFYVEDSGAIARWESLRGAQKEAAR